MRRTLLFAAGALLLSAAHASAQAQAPAAPPAQTSSGLRTWEGRGFFNINVGLQNTSREFAEEVSFSLYDELGQLTGTHQVDGGTIIDFGGGFRVWRNLAVGLSFNRFKDSDDVQLEGPVPHPVFFNRPRAATSQLGALDHQESIVHLQATWVQPVADNIDVSVFFGPSFFTVKQDVVIGPQLPPVETAPFTSVTVGLNAGELEESAVGFNIGADVTYMVIPNVGGGFFIRYSGASIDLEGGSQGPFSLDVGGLQLGGGLRVRF